MVKIQNPFRRFWESDRGLSMLLIVLLVLIFVVPASGFTRPVGRVVIDVLITLLMLTGVSAISSHRAATRLVFAIATTGLAIRWIGQFAESPAMDIAVALSGGASIATLGCVVLAQVLRAGPVNQHRIMGAIAVYLLSGLAWAETYLAIELLSPGSFSTAASVALIRESWIYYSFVTLTTVGYGDITPVSSVARSLAILEALTGQLYPAILLARLVSLEVSSRESGKRGENHGRETDPQEGP